MLKNLENLAAANPTLYRSIVGQIKGERGPTLWSFQHIYMSLLQSFLLDDKSGWTVDVYLDTYQNLYLLADAYDFTS